MAYALFLLTVLVIGVGLWVCAVRTGVQRRIAKWIDGRVRRKALLWMIAGIIMFAVEWVGFAYLDARPGTQIAGKGGGVGTLMGLGWLIAWFSVAVLIRGKTTALTHSTVANVIVVLAYIFTGLPITLGISRGLSALSAFL